MALVIRVLGGQGVFFFFVAPFCSCPASLVSRKFFAVGPGCAKCVFFVALRWAPRPFGGARQKKKHHPGCFFFLLRPRGKAREGEAPLEAGTGPEQKKKHHPGCVFFAAAPAKGKGRRSPVGSRHGARAKKKKHQPGCLFFAPAPGKGRGRRSPVGRRHGARAKSLFFFCSGPVPAPNGASPSLAFRRGRSQKKNTLGGVFFAAAPRGRSLTHCGPGWRCLPLAGAVFFFLLRPRPDRGGVFFFAVALPGRSLTHGGLGDFGKARLVFFFFAAAPPGLFRQ